MITITDTVLLGGPATGTVRVLRGFRELHDLSRWEIKRELARLRAGAMARAGKGDAHSLPPLRALTAEESARLSADIALLERLYAAAPAEPSVAELEAAFEAEQAAKAAAYRGPGCFKCKGACWCSDCDNRYPGGAS